MEAIEKEQLDQVSEQSEVVDVSEIEAEVTEKSEAEDVSVAPVEDSTLETYEEEDIEPPPQGSFFHFGRPTREQLLTWIPFWAVILLGAVLRFWNVGDKPLHHDESMHAYFSMGLLHDLQNWLSCANGSRTCYQYTPLLHGPFQFHAIAFVYWISGLLGAPDNGINTTTARIAAATLGTVIVALPYFLRDYLGKLGALLSCLLLAVSPSMVYFSRFAREDIYMACFTLLLVVAMARYVRDRKMRWLVVAAAALSLSYATKEATFLTVLVFGGFAVGLIAWELGARVPLRERLNLSSSTAAYVPRTYAPVYLGVYAIIAGIGAKFLFGWLKALSIYVTDPKTSAASDLFVTKLKDYTVSIIPWLGILLGLYIFSILAREIYGKLPPPGRHGLAKHVDPQKQPLLDTILTMSWTHWFFALLCGWAIFLLLFTVEFTNIRGGIGDGIWQGLYYWLQQQQVARGGQPWYYYLMLIPLYEQVGLVFGLAGVVYCLVRPTRFRLFMVFWFVGNVFLYSWAAEKMPWLMIHMTMPMMILGGIALTPLVKWAYTFVKQSIGNAEEQTSSATEEEEERGASVAEEEEEQDDIKMVPPPPPSRQARPRISVARGVVGIAGVILAAVLLIPTVHNTYEVSYIHPADGPHEMMIYVQTTYDVNTVMAHVDAVDRKLDGGNHQLHIGLLSDALWPFAWYVRDYPNACYSYPNCAGWTQDMIKNTPVIIAGGDNPYGAEAQYSGHGGTYLYHQYHMRSWWDEGYKPPPCIPTKTNNCDGQPDYGGVGVGLWLSYGDNPPPNAKFNLGLAAQNIWQWEWNRRAIGSTDGNYDMVLFIQNNIGIAP